MQSAILAVVGAALIVLLISAFVERRANGLSFGQAFAHSFFKFVFGARFRGFRDNADGSGPILYLVNTQSGMDALLLKSYLPKGTFYIELSAAGEHTFTLIRSVLRGKGHVCVMGPAEMEPSPSTVEKLKRLAEVTQSSPTRIVAIHIRGARHSLASNFEREMAPRSLLPQLFVTAASPFAAMELPEEHPQDALIDAMAAAKFRSVNLSNCLFEAVVQAAKQFGPAAEILEDPLGGRLSYRQLLIGARLLASRFSSLAPKGEAVGLLLPNSNGLVLSIFSLLSSANPAALLNYTAGPAAIASAVRTARLRHVISSRAFIEKAELSPLVAAIEGEGCKLVYLEDVKAQATFTEKLPASLLWRYPVRKSKATDTAVILFTSGSEGSPKGVALSSRNLIANAAQADCRVDISPADTLFNVLPLFHSFGLLGGLVLPLLYGVKLYLYPSPLHFKLVPSIARKVAPTIMFGTDTFLQGYGRAAKDGDFQSVRMIVAGAEAVRPETRKLYFDRFGARILEGYGMTEASPVVAVNSATFSKDGTVGRPLTGIEIRLEPVEGLEDGHRLAIAGPNVMKGYIFSAQPGVVQRPSGKWHGTGDIVTVDARKFISIRGRAKRFAKIAGEMVSLGAVETMVQRLWPEGNHAVVSVPDERRGERIVLLTTQKSARRDELVDYARRYGAAELSLPDRIVEIDALPLLGSGKTDYSTAIRIAKG